MNSKSFLAKTAVLTLFLAGFGFAVYAIGFTSPEPMLQRVQQQQQAGGFAYAQLTQLEDSQVRWDFGGNEIVRVRSLTQVYRELGGQGRPTMVNLLNSIGNQGWELVQTSDNVSTFKRRN